MCNECWGNYGSPKLYSATVAALVAAIPDIDPYGAFHIVVDDWNLDDDYIKSCINDPDCTDEERAFGEAMLAASIEERASAMAIIDGLFEPS